MALLFQILEGCNQTFIKQTITKISASSLHKMTKKMQNYFKRIALSQFIWRFMFQSRHRRIYKSLVFDDVYMTAGMRTDRIKEETNKWSKDNTDDDKSFGIRRLYQSACPRMIVATCFYFFLVCRLDFSCFCCLLLLVVVVVFVVFQGWVQVEISKFA